MENNGDFELSELSWTSQHDKAMTTRPMAESKPGQGPPSLKKSTSSKQTSIAGFFQKKASAPTANGSPKTNGTALPVRQSPIKKAKRSTLGSDQSLTPAPSSDPTQIQEELEAKSIPPAKRGTSHGLPSPITPAGDAGGQQISSGRQPPVGFYSPSRKVELADP